MRRKTIPFAYAESSWSKITRQFARHKPKKEVFKEFTISKEEYEQLYPLAALQQEYSEIYSRLRDRSNNELYQDNDRLTPQQREAFTIYTMVVVLYTHRTELYNKKLESHRRKLLQDGDTDAYCRTFSRDIDDKQKYMDAVSEVTKDLKIVDSSKFLKEVKTYCEESAAFKETFDEMTQGLPAAINKLINKREPKRFHTIDLARIYNRMESLLDTINVRMMRTKKQEAEFRAAYTFDIVCIENACEPEDLEPSKDSSNITLQNQWMNIQSRIADIDKLAFK